MPVYIWYPMVSSLAVGVAFMNIPPLADQFMTLYGVNYGGLSFFLSGLLWAHCLCQVPAGLAVDRLGVYRSLLLASLAGTAVNLAPFLAPRSLALAVSMRFILGLCTGLMFLSMLKIIGFLAPPERMARAQALQGGSFGLGIMIPYLGLPYLGAWPWSYLMGAFIFFAVFLGSFALPRAQLEQTRPRRRPPGQWAEMVIAVAKSKEIWALGLVHGLSYGTLNNLGQWLPSILSEAGGGTIASWSLAATLTLLIGMAGRSGSGLILKLASRRAVINRVIVIVSVLYLGLGLTSSPGLALALGLALAAVSGLNYGSLFTLGSQVMPTAYMATALGFMNMAANLGNVALTLLLGYAKEFSGVFRWGLIGAGLAGLAAWLICRGLIARLDEKTP